MSTEVGPPRLVIQVVSWNDVDTIDACLESLAAQQQPGVEILVIDNASADGTAEAVARWFDDGRVRGAFLPQDENTGFCGGHNRGFAHRRSDWVLLLNPDAVLADGFVERALRATEEVDDDVGTIAPRILLPDGRVDSVGLLRDWLRRAWDRGYGEPPEVFDRPEDVFGCTGAVALHRRAMLEDVAVAGEILDEAIFAYNDDLDLSWRAQLRGWRCRYLPELEATHHRAARNALRGIQGRQTARMDQILTVRNRLLVMVRCEPARSLWWGLPLWGAFELARVGFLTWKSPGILKAYADLVPLLRPAFRQRHLIQGGVRLRRSRISMGES